MIKDSAVAKRPQAFVTAAHAPGLAAGQQHAGNFNLTHALTSS
jgi:hypothetical protein